MKLCVLMCQLCVSTGGQTRHITVITNSEEVYRNVNNDLYHEHLTNITETAYVSWYWTAVHGCYRSVIGGHKTEKRVRRLVAVFSPWRPGFDFRLACVVFVVERVARGAVLHTLPICHRRSIILVFDSIIK
jgi:hypothetical protein